MANITVAASASVYLYKAVPVGLMGSLTSPVATLSFKVYANDESVSLNLLQYSLDGKVFENISLIDPPDMTNINGTKEGTNLTVTWDIYEDIEDNYFNVPVHIRAQVTDGVEGSIISTATFTMEKTVNDLSRKTPEIPVGTPGVLDKQKLPSKM